MLTREQITEDFFRDVLTDKGYDPKEVISIIQKIEQTEPEVYGIKAKLDERNLLQISGCYTGLKVFHEWYREYYDKLQRDINATNWFLTFSPNCDRCNIDFKLPISKQRLEIVIEESEIHE